MRSIITVVTLSGDVPYWRIRNTWGTDWGEDGFVRVLYGNKMCGMYYTVLPGIHALCVLCDTTMTFMQV